VLTTCMNAAVVNQPRWPCRLNPTTLRKKSAAPRKTKMTTPAKSTTNDEEELIHGFDALLERVAVYSRRFPDVVGRCSVELC
jgi:hypothetical protein